MQPVVVGIREFRARLAEFLIHGTQPVAVTRHGATIGYFIPARAARSDRERAALKAAAVKMDALLRSSGLTDAELDESMRDFRTWRAKRKRR